jgi:RNA polymerase sigma-70 factor (ECF subfamily)
VLLRIPHLRSAADPGKAGRLQSALLPSATLAEFYRFALLLTGHSKAAEEVMAATLVEVESQLGQFRNERNRHAWLATRIRERCMHNRVEAAAAPRLLREEAETSDKLEVLKIEAYLVAQRFHLLPEPERSALALFYLELFTVEEIAELLKMSLEQLAETLAGARSLLRESLQTMQQPAT